MPDLATLERLFALVDKYGSSWAALVVGSGLLVVAGRAVANGAKYIWGKAEPHVEGILGAHKDLMVTAKDQIPRQTAILERLSEGQHENAVLLASIDSNVKRFVPTSTTPRPIREAV